MRATDPEPGSHVKSVTLLATIGTVAEYYDFALAGACAALVWPFVFFPSSSSAAGFALSFGTYGSALLFQPVGAALFGHLGDRRGRKPSLVLTLSLMGIGSLGLGLVPSYEAIGALAPLLVVAMRVLQGIGFGGELSGSATWVAEAAADTNRRSFWTGFLSVSRTAGALLSFSMFYAVSAVLPRAEFLGSGWRLLFIGGAAALLVGVVVRYRFTRDILYLEAKARNALVKAPVISAAKKDWGTILALGVSTTGFLSIILVMLQSFSLNYLTKVGVGVTFAAELLVLGRTPELVVTPAATLLADRFGRKATLIAGGVACLIPILLFYPLLHTSSVGPVVLGFALLGISSSFGYASAPALFAESFPTSHRFSGVGLAYNIPVLVTGSLTTFVIPLYIAAFGGAVGAANYVAITIFGITAVSIVAGLVVHETRTADMH